MPASSANERCRYDCLAVQYTFGLGHDVVPAACAGQPNSAAELRAMVSSLKNKTAAKAKKRARTKD